MKMKKEERNITRHDIMAIADKKPLKCSAPGPWKKGVVYLLGLGKIQRYETITEASKHAAANGRRIKVTLY